MPVWDSDAKFKLLLAVLDVLKPSGSPDWDQVAARLGSDITASAVRQQYNKIRKAVGSELALGADKSADKPGVAVTNNPATKKRKTAKKDVDAEDDQPEPKRKVIKKSVVKEEPDEIDGMAKREEEAVA